MEEKAVTFEQLPAVVTAMRKDLIAIKELLETICEILQAMNLNAGFQLRNCVITFPVIQPQQLFTRGFINARFHIRSLVRD